MKATSPMCSSAAVQMQTSSAPALSDADVSYVIQMAWADDIPFEAIALQFGLSEAGVIRLMRRHLKPASFRLWRKRVSGRATKHGARLAFTVREQRLSQSSRTTR
jgi:uncharacterized protein (TIGR03643 family)